MELRTILGLIYSIALKRIPGFAMFLPLDALFAIAEAVSVGINQKLRVDLKITDWFGLLRMLKEVAEAALLPTKQAQAEAIYAMLSYVTDIEEKMSIQQFLEMSREEQDLLPDSQFAEPTP